MCKIEKVSVNNAKKIKIDKSLWGYDEYKPEVTLQISYDDLGFNVLYTVFEKNPKRDKKTHFEPVHEDSCVELFLNFMPKSSEKYINFEVNANGVMNVAFRKDRQNKKLLKKEEINDLGIKAEIFDNYWCVSYKISYDLIKGYYPDFDINTCEYLLGNAYKCGDKTNVPHYISLFEVGCEKPDFHRPEYFNKFEILK